MEYSDDLPSWIPRPTREIIATQATTTGNDPIHSCICLPTPQLSYLETILQDLYRNPLSVTFPEKARTTVNVDEELSDDEKPDALILKASTDVGVTYFEGLEEELSEIQFSDIGATPKFPEEIPVILLVEPDKGEYDDYYSISDQVPVPIGILRNFHFVSTIQSSSAEALEGVVSPTESSISTNLRDEIRTVRESSTQRPTDAAQNRLSEFYSSIEQGSPETFPVTPNFVTGLLRIAQTKTLSRNGTKVSKSDVEYATSISEDLVIVGGLNLDDSNFDISKIETNRDKRKSTSEIIEELCSEKSGDEALASKEEIIEYATEEGISEEVVEKDIEKGRMKGSILEVKEGEFMAV